MPVHTYIITSNNHPSTWYASEVGKQDAVLRRITQIIECKKDDGVMELPPPDNDADKWGPETDEQREAVMRLMGKRRKIETIPAIEAKEEEEEQPRQRMPWDIPAIELMPQEQQQAPVIQRPLGPDGVPLRPVVPRAWDEQFW